MDLTSLVHELQLADTLSPEKLLQLHAPPCQPTRKGETQDKPVSSFHPSALGHPARVQPPHRTSVNRETDPTTKSRLVSTRHSQSHMTERNQGISVLCHLTKPQHRLSLAKRLPQKMCTSRTAQLTRSRTHTPRNPTYFRTHQTRQPRRPKSTVQNRARTAYRVS